jgi:hypothetical protein
MTLKTSRHDFPQPMECRVIRKLRGRRTIRVKANLSDGI